MLSVFYSELIYSIKRGPCSSHAYGPLISVFIERYQVLIRLYEHNILAPKCRSRIYNINLGIVVPTGAPTSNGVKPSACTELITKLEIFSWNISDFRWFRYFAQDNVTRNRPEISRNIAELPSVATLGKQNGVYHCHIESDKTTSIYNVSTRVLSKNKALVERGK